MRLHINIKEGDHFCSSWAHVKLSSTAGKYGSGGGGSSIASSISTRRRHLFLVVLSAGGYKTLYLVVLLLSSAKHVKRPPSQEYVNVTGLHFELQTT